MSKKELKNIINTFLKKDIDFCIDTFNEWEHFCNQYKTLSKDNANNPERIKKMTYNEICSRVIKDALENFPKDVLKQTEEEIKDFLTDGWLYDLFLKHNNPERR